MKQHAPHVHPIRRADHAPDEMMFVHLTDGEDGVGIGEATLNGHEQSLVRVVDAKARTAPGAIGEPPGMFAERERPRDLVEAAVVSAVDHALWDLHGRSRQRAVVNVLGGPRRRTIPVYANINRRTRVRTPEAFATSARDALRAGYAAIKLAPFDNARAAQTPAENRDGFAKGLGCIATVREAIGPERRLMVDCHWRFDENLAARWILEADPLAPHWIQCPMPETEANMRAMVRLRALANERGIRLAGLEQAVRLEAFQPWCEAGAHDAMMSDVKYAGGLSEILRIGDALYRRTTPAALFHTR